MQLHTLSKQANNKLQIINLRQRKMTGMIVTVATCAARLLLAVACIMLYRMTFSAASTWLMLRLGRRGADSVEEGSAACAGTAFEETEDEAKGEAEDEAKAEDEAEDDEDDEDEDEGTEVADEDAGGTADDAEAEGTAEAEGDVTSNVVLAFLRGFFSGFRRFVCGAGRSLASYQDFFCKCQHNKKKRYFLDCHNSSRTSGLCKGKLGSTCAARCCGTVHIRANSRSPIDKLTYLFTWANKLATRTSKLSSLNGSTIVTGRSTCSAS